MAIHITYPRFYLCYTSVADELLLQLHQQFWLLVAFTCTFDTDVYISISLNSIGVFNRLISDVRFFLEQGLQVSSEMFDNLSSSFEKVRPRHF